MIVPLFEEIHSYLDYDRTHPATLSEFLDFGLLPADYVEYVGLQHMFQGAILLGGVSAKNPKTEEALHALIEFCVKKNLIDSQHFFDEVKLIDYAAYYIDWRNDWQKYPKDENAFRLCIERKLSLRWDDETAYIFERLGIIDFWYDSYDDEELPEYNDPVRIRKYNPEKNEFEILQQHEVLKIFEIVKNDQCEINKKIKDLESIIPADGDLHSYKTAPKWLKELNTLHERQWIIDCVYEQFSTAIQTPDIKRIKPTDVLYVFYGEDVCKLNRHKLNKVRAEFDFFCGKKRISITRCAHCMRYQISSQEYFEILEAYGIPECIVMDNSPEHGNVSGFPIETIFSENRYTVNENDNLSALARQRILKHIIDSGKATKKETLAFLWRRISFNGRKPGNEFALSKWKEDYEFVRKL